jgi:hypothetical protein
MIRFLVFIIGVLFWHADGLFCQTVNKRLLSIGVGNGATWTFNKFEQGVLHPALRPIPIRSFLFAPISLECRLSNRLSLSLSYMEPQALANFEVLPGFVDEGYHKVALGIIPHAFPLLSHYKLFETKKLGVTLTAGTSYAFTHHIIGYPKEVVIAIVSGDNAILVSRGTEKENQFNLHFGARAGMMMSKRWELRGSVLLNQGMRTYERMYINSRTNEGHYLQTVNLKGSQVWALLSLHHHIGFKQKKNLEKQEHAENYSRREKKFSVGLGFGGTLSQADYYSTSSEPAPLELRPSVGLTFAPFFVEYSLWKRVHFQTG